MKRTDASGNLSGLYTDGNPTTGTPATVVNASALNNIQEELCNLIVNQGITLDGTIMTQLQQAIALMIQSGGVVSVPNFSVANNQVAAANVTGATVGPVASYVAARMQYKMTRKSTADGEFNATGIIELYWCPTAQIWKINVEESNDGDDHGVTFSVATGVTPNFTAQLQYQSTNLSATGYVSTLRISNVSLVKA